MTSSKSKKLEAQSAAHLLELVELADIVIYEVHGVRRDSADENNVVISVQERHDEKFIEPRFRMIVTDSNAQYTADVATRYVLTRPIELPRPVLREFIERVAIMAAFPFIRESIATTAARMELGVPVLGLLRAGSFTLDEGDLQETATEQM